MYDYVVPVIAFTRFYEHFWAQTQNDLYGKTSWKSLNKRYTDCRCKNDDATTKCSIFALNFSAIYITIDNCRVDENIYAWLIHSTAATLFSCIIPLRLFIAILNSSNQHLWKFFASLFFSTFILCYCMVLLLDVCETYYGMTKKTTNTLS